MDTMTTFFDALYAAFNARDVEGVLAAMHPDVDWPNGVDGGRIHGHSAVRDYWTRQWRVVDPRVTPVRVVTDEEGNAAVEVHQVVHDKAGVLLIDQTVRHAYHMRGGLIVYMDIQPADAELIPPD
jgi:ketosteroid isomerase-like protein